MLNLFDSYLDSYVSDTESPTIYHRWCLISTVSALLGRNFVFPLGHFTIYPNQFCMLIGQPGARKSGAINIAKKLLKTSGYAKVAEGRTTKEKFLMDLQGMEDGEQLTGLDALLASSGDDYPHEMYIAADEFNNFLGTGNYEFLSLLGELWDCPDHLPVRTKNSKSYTIKQPVVNIIAGNTHAGFAAAFPPDIMGQGFLSRLILIFAAPTSSKITFPEKPTEAQTAALVAHLELIRLHVHGEATVSAEAATAIDYLYKHQVDIPDARFKHYSSRRLTHLIKVCLVCAAIRLSKEIALEDVILANTILAYTEHYMPAAMGEFGKSKHSDVTGRILEVIGNATAPVTPLTIWKQVHTELERFQQLPDIIAGLVQAEKIQRVGAGFLLNLAVLKEGGKYLDFSLLQECR